MTEAPRIRIRTIAFPVEHGGWGFLAEPILLGLVLVPSGAGLAIGTGTAAAFLVRHPAKLFWRNRHRLDLSPRFRLARRFAVLYAGIALAAFALAAGMAGRKVLAPFVFLSPLLAAFAVFDVSNRARQLLPELVAPLGLAASAPAIALAGGWGWIEAWTLWLLLGARAVPSILYVRARLRLERGETIDRRASLAAHGGAFALGIGLARLDLAPWLGAAALGILLVRSVRGLSAHRRPAKARQVGFSELAWGLAYVLLLALGFRAGL
jgi:hypothetical protein